MNFSYGSRRLLSWLERLSEARKCLTSWVQLPLLSTDYWAPVHRCAPSCMQLRATWCSHCNLALEATTIWQPKSTD